MAETTFLWHDYETWGINPRFYRPAQFAAIRTDTELNPIGDPVMMYAKPALDMLPQPQACLVTGITPQKAYAEGQVEAEFIKSIHKLMSQPGTCSVGYNSIRFDDEFTRYSLYRNFFDPYEREWKNQNSRWDLIDVVRLCAAVRPEGIQWPLNDEGLPSFRLEALTAANHIEQTGAHDALVDVRATIDLARLIKEKQPKLFDYGFSMRSKQAAAKAVALGSFKPVLHISGMFGSENHCASIVLPLCMHPTNKNAVVCIDLRHAPDEFLSLSVPEIQKRIFSKTDELEGLERVHLKSIHLNKSPMVAPVSMATEEVAQRIGLDLKQMRANYDALMVNQAAWIKAKEVFEAQEFEPEKDPDAMLYSGGFFSDHDKATIKRVRNSSPKELAEQTFVFEDSRLDELLFRYRARNYPESLLDEEKPRWEEYRIARLTHPDTEALQSLEDYQLELETLFEQHEQDENNSEILGALMSWGDEVLCAG